MLSRTTPFGITETWTYDGFNDVTSHTDGNGNTTTYAYNAKGDETSMTQPGAGGHHLHPESDYRGRHRHHRSQRPHHHLHLQLGRRAGGGHHAARRGDDLHLRRRRSPHHHGRRPGQRQRWHALGPYHHLRLRRLGPADLGVQPQRGHDLLHLRRGGEPDLGYRPQRKRRPPIPTTPPII